MPAHVVRHDPDRPAQLTVRLPGSLKNDVTQAAEAEGMSVNAWVLTALKSILVGGLNAPAPIAPVVTPELVIKDYLEGKTTIGPCGKPWPCEGQGAASDFGGSRWCDACGIRLS